MRIRLLLTVVVAIALSVSQVAVAETDIPSSWGNFKLGGYLSAGVNVHPNGKTDGAFNEVAPILTWENDSRFRFLAELDIEEPLGFNENNQVNSDSESSGVYAHLGANNYYLERFYLDYNLTDKLSLRTGRFLTPASYWNLEHAPPLVWTTSRPLITSQLFPQGTNGFMAYGAVPLANNAFEYSVFVGTLKDKKNDQQDALNRDVAYDNIQGARFTLSGKVNWGLSVLKFHEDEPSNTGYQMLELDFFTQHDGWEFSGEASQRYYSNYSDGGHGAYLQGVAPLGNQWYAIARVENFKSAATGYGDRLVLGATWRTATNRMLKIEYVGGSKELPESPKGVLASFAILF